MVSLYFNFQKNGGKTAAKKAGRYELNVEHMFLISLSTVIFTIKLEKGE